MTPVESATPKPKTRNYLLTLFARRRREPPDWPDAPKGRPDNDFEVVALGGVGAAELVAFDPAFAQEIFLALLIDPPPEYEDNDYDMNFFGKLGLNASTVRLATDLGLCARSPTSRCLAGDWHRSYRSITELLSGSLA